MSVFKSIKGTFQNIQHDIAEGLKSITSSGPLKDDSSKPSKSSSVNLDAGAEILHKYQTVWKDLYDGAECNAEKAEEVDSMIGDLYVQCDRCSEVLGRLHEQASSMPVLLQQLQDMTDVLAALEEEYDRVEVELVHLENICDEQDIQRDMDSHRQQLTVYRQKKNNELEKIKVQMAKDHTLKIRKFESTRQTHLKERQETFEEQFEQDVDYFKVHGHAPRQLSTDSGEKPDLAEICPEEDQRALDEFLAANEDAPVTDETTDSKSEANQPSVSESASDVVTQKTENPGSVDKIEDSDNKLQSSDDSTNKTIQEVNSEKPDPVTVGETQENTVGEDNSAVNSVDSSGT